ncbi:MULTISPECIES: Gfo/Idh/MocA family protein [unclassified Cryobacterium]|uniref:Gfo/Idh/MocA family protein n=1 Tax=unclassified Cryobacterium TaxID=2649013 RepID=UPI00106C093E|nr:MULTISPECIES: Gfo/Idh/MocA family oxidoreductase [unclassified Cryobacterium]TFC53772.1 Gfo/Idh/MocA family oxidoreductase [Cryobacterium sp. TMB3-1-2]TFC75192.1 Gfo/Idh/MocA family oxidoreductase [Cryobacterium sp. TMB3-15]TFC75328.1 Gfo/Idh/MocA family oxidoreductase [Cryobacterium sp. TMB3-10]TFD41605.1 Gfo/Idh/MocA family oxidoreductase [Cryobacterium sp. TMB3-12]
MADQTPLRVALIGTAFMGAAHSQAWRTAPRFFDLPREPEMALLVGRSADTTAAQATKLGWQEWSTDWREAVSRDDIDVIDICTPGDTHAEIALAALAAGKHVLCEKPLANSVAEAVAMADAAEQAAQSGVLSMCGFSYRRTPALALARRFIAEGRLGAIRHVRADYLQDWLSDPAAPLSWRLDKAKAGSGALGDIGAHSIDTAQWLTGESITEVSATLRTFVTERPQRGAAAGLGGVADPDAARGPVTVDDAMVFTATFSGGALGVFEATRMATGRRNANRIEINGESGSIAFDFERMNELEYFDGRGTDPEAEGFRRIVVTDPVHPYVANWWPTGHGLGYEHLFTHQIVDFVTAIGAGTAPSPGFVEALDVQRVLAAVEASAKARSQTTPVERRTA